MGKVMKQILRIPYGMFNFLAYRGFFKWIPDEPYLKIQYKAFFGCELNLDKPKTFNEKLQWLKLHDRNSLYITMSDKFAVKEYIREKLGKDYVIPLIGGPWKNADEINFDELPNQFVLKCTHDSGGLVICRDKNTLDKKAAKKILNKSLSKNYFYWCREWAYKDIKPLIIAEKYMEDSNSSESKMKQCLTDYKFYCFNGKVKYLYVSVGLENHKTARISFLTPDWKFAPFNRSDYIPYDKLPEKPHNYSKMIEIAEYLSKGIPFLRVDLFELNKNIYFSEFTFYPCGGFMPVIPNEWDKKLGELLIL